MYNKRGLSAVITTLLIILLVLVAIGVVWGVIRKIIRSGTEDVSLSGLTLDLDIKDAYESGDNIIVKVERKVGKGDLVGLKFVLSGEDYNDVLEESTAMEELEQETFTLSPIDSSAAQTVSIAPIYKTGGGEKIGDVVDTFTIRRGTGGGAYCGDGSCNGDETCTTCEADCGSCGEGAYCGDGSCNDDETCTTCEADCGSCGGGAVCGNFIVETGEECDTSGAFNCIDTGLPNECTCEAGFLPDPDSNGCIEDESVVCDGIFDGNEQCDGGADCIAPGEPNECTCPDSYDPDGVGGCIAWTPVNVGIVEEVWPPDTGMYFASSDLPEDRDYTGYYVSYTDAIECLLIVNYVTPDISGYDKTHVAFNFATDILVGDDYKIWETVQRCEASL